MSETHDRAMRAKDELIGAMREEYAVQATKRGKSPEPDAKQIRKMELASEYVELLHPTSLDDDGNPKVVVVKANTVQEKLALGFRFVAAAS